jgi:hypothetical protein
MAAADPSHRFHRLGGMITAMRSLLRATIGRVLFVVALIGCPLAVATSEAAKTYTAERFDAHVRVMPGGALEVTETIAFRFESGTFDHVFREIPVRRTDGIEIVRASLDGRPFPIGDGVNQIQVTGRSKVRVQWRFYPLADSTHVFVLTYIARGVVSRSAGADVLAWRALPSEHQYQIASSTVDFEMPAGVRPPSGAVPQPKIDSHGVEGPVETTTRSGNEDTATPSVIARATASRIRSNGWLEARFELPAGSIVTSPPAWQLAQQTAQGLANRWITAAILVALSGLILLFGLRQQYDPPRRDQPAASPAPAPPDSLAPGLVGPLLSSGRPSLEHAMAALFSLADRGVIAIEEHPRGFLGHSFDIRRLQSRATLAGHERALIEIALEQMRAGSTVSLGSARRRLVRRFRQFSAAVQQDLLSAGLVDLDRKRVRDRYFRISIVALVLAGVSVPLFALLLTDRYGPWPMLIPAAFAVVGMTGLIFAGATTPLSNEGLRRAAGWRGFRAYLKTLTQDRGQSAVQGVETFAPYAMATGLAAGWAKYLKRHPGSVPAWFRALSTSSRDRAFTAFVTSSGAHHGGAGAGGAGAAGGGASGAG